MQKQVTSAVIQEAVDGTAFNNEYFVRNPNGECKFLNVPQGENFAQADDWYSQMKSSRDPQAVSQMFILTVGQWVVKTCATLS